MSARRAARRLTRSAAARAKARTASKARTRPGQGQDSVGGARPRTRRLGTRGEAWADEGDGLGRPADATRGSASEGAARAPRRLQGRGGGVCASEGMVCI